MFSAKNWKNLYFSMVTDSLWEALSFLMYLFFIFHFPTVISLPLLFIHKCSWGASYVPGWVLGWG